jgi:hypothetical protein
VQEIKQLFDIEQSRILKESDLQQAKRKVLGLHPDKSKLPPEYFIFYRLAYEKLTAAFAEDTKQTAPVRQRDYDVGSIENENLTETVRRQIQAQSGKSFNQTFNQLFESNMTISTKDAEDRMEWFRNESPIYNVKSRCDPKNMGTVFNELRSSSSSSSSPFGPSFSLIQAPSTLGMHCCHFLSKQDEESATSQEYISSNLFSKLKYDDLRKVHRDESIFRVSEETAAKVHPHESLEQNIKLRNQQSVASPMDTAQAQAFLRKEQEDRENQIRWREQLAKEKAKEYRQKQDKVLSYFLALK